MAELAQRQFPFRLGLIRDGALLVRCGVIATVGTRAEVKALPEGRAAAFGCGVPGSDIVCEKDGRKDPDVVVLWRYPSPNTITLGTTPGSIPVCG